MNRYLYDAHLGIKAPSMLEALAQASRIQQNLVHGQGAVQINMIWGDAAWSDNDGAFGDDAPRPYTSSARGICMIPIVAWVLAPDEIAAIDGILGAIPGVLVNLKPYDVIENF